MRPLHAAFRSLNASEDVASPDDHGDFHPGLHQRFHLVGVQRKLLIVNAKLLVAHEGLTTQLQEDATILHRSSKMRPNSALAQMKTGSRWEPVPQSFEAARNQSRLTRLNPVMARSPPAASLT